MAMPRATGPQTRSTFDREPKLARVPNAKKPVKTHIPILNVPVLRLVSIKPDPAKIRKMIGG
jgi:hypothetical protein